MSAVVPKAPAEVVAELLEELQQLPPVPKCLWLNPSLFAALERAKAPDGERAPFRAVRGIDCVKTWAIEMSDGTFQLPEEELEGDG